MVDGRWIEVVEVERRRRPVVGGHTRVVAAVSASRYRLIGISIPEETGDNRVGEAAQATEVPQVNKVTPRLAAGD